MEYDFYDDKILFLEIFKENYPVADLDEVLYTLDKDLYFLIDYRLTEIITYKEDYPIPEFLKITIPTNITDIRKWFMDNNVSDVRIGYIIIGGPEKELRINNLYSDYPNLIFNILTKEEIKRRYGQVLSINFGKIKNVYDSKVIETTTNYSETEEPINFYDVKLEKIGDNKIITKWEGAMNGWYKTINYLLDKWNPII